MSDILTEQAVTDLLKSSRSRRLQYLCRAYLQFGASVMLGPDLDEIRKALRSKAAK